MLKTGVSQEQNIIINNINTVNIKISQHGKDFF